MDATPTPSPRGGSPRLHCGRGAAILSALRWAATLLAGTCALSLAAAAAAVAFAGAGSPVFGCSWWGLWSVVLAFAGLSTLWDLTELGGMHAAAALRLRRRHDRMPAGRGAPGAPAPTPAAAAHPFAVAAGEPAPARAGPQRAALVTTFMQPPPTPAPTAASAGDSPALSPCAAAPGAPGPCIDLAVLRDLLRDHKRASAAGAGAGGMGLEHAGRAAGGQGALYSSQMRHVSVSAKVRLPRGCGLASVLWGISWIAHAGMGLGSSLCARAAFHSAPRASMHTRMRAFCMHARQ
jgi:hypothetical protein